MECKNWSRLQHCIAHSNEFTLNYAVFSLWHRFLDNLTINALAILQSRPRRLTKPQEVVSEHELERQPDMQQTTHCWGSAGG